MIELCRLIDYAKKELFSLDRSLIKEQSESKDCLLPVISKSLTIMNEFYLTAKQFWKNITI